MTSWSFLHAWLRFSWVFIRAIESTSERNGLSFFRCAGVVLRSFPLFSVSKLIRSSRRWFQTIGLDSEFQAPGDNDGISFFFHHSPLPACGCIPSGSQAARLLRLSGSSSLTRNTPSRASSLSRGSPSSRASRMLLLHQSRGCGLVCVYELRYLAVRLSLEQYMDMVLVMVPL